MKPTLLAFAAAATVALTSPAQALSFQVDFPNLTYPPKTDTQTSQACVDLTSPTGTTCTQSSK